MSRYSMDNPDPNRHRPKRIDWRWDDCPTSVEVGYGAQLTLITKGDWGRLVRALGPQGRGLAERLRMGSEGLRRCACGSAEVVRYHAPAGEPPVGLCRVCWEKETGEVLGAGADLRW